MVWELVFMLVILKIPVVYLCAVVWYAIRAEPRPLAGAAVHTRADPPPGCDWKRRIGPGRPGPRGGRGGRLVRGRRVATAQLRHRRIEASATSAPERG